MLNILCSGTLVRDPQQRQGANKPFAMGNMRVPVEGGEATFVSIIAFDPDAVAALMALHKGDSLSVAGRAKLTTWEKTGETRHGISVTADQVLTAYSAQAKRKAAVGERKAA